MSSKPTSLAWRKKGRRQLHRRTTTWAIDQAFARARPWQETFAQVPQMHAWVLQVESIFDGNWASTPQELTTVAVQARLESWLGQLETFVGTLPQDSRLFLGLGELAQVVRHLQPHLICCYDLKGLPRTNNDLERCIRAIKTRYRRISGRKNWNAYLLRYGRAVAYYEWWSTQPQGQIQLDDRFPLITRRSWRAIRDRARMLHQPQLNRFRFQHARQVFLTELETLWLDACCT